MFNGLDDPIRLSPAPSLGDALLHLAAPEPFPQRLSLLETQIRILSGRIATLEARTLPARWRRLLSWLRWRREQTAQALARGWQAVWEERPWR